MENIRKYQIKVTELKNTMTELKNMLVGFKNTVDEAKDHSTQRQSSRTHPIRAAKRQKRMEKSKDSFKNIWQNQTNTWIIGFPEEKRERGKTITWRNGDWMLS